MKKLKLILSTLLLLMQFMVTAEAQDSTEIFIELGHELSISKISISSNKKYVLSEGAGTYKLWDYQSKQLIKTIPIPNYHSFEEIAITPDGKYIIGRIGKYNYEYDTGAGTSRSSYTLTATTSYSIEVIDISSGKPVGETLTYKSTSQDPVDMLLSRDGTLMVVPASGKIDVYNISTFEKVQSKSFRGVAHQVMFSEDGSHIYISKKEGDVFAGLFSLNIETGQLKSIYKDKTEGYQGLALSGDGKKALSVDSKRRAEFWDLNTGQTLNKYRVKRSGIGRAGVASVNLSDNGKLAVVEYMDKKNYIIAYRYAIINNNNGYMHGLYNHPNDWGGNVKISPDNDYVFFFHPLDAEVIFNISKGDYQGYDKYEESDTFKYVKNKRPFSLTASAFCAGENAILTSSGSDMVKMSLNTEEIYSTFGAKIESPSAFIRMPDGKSLLAGRHIWDIETGRMIKALPQQELRSYYLDATSPDGKSILISTEEDFNVRVREFNLENLKFTNTYKLPKSNAKDFKGRNRYKYSPDGKYLVASTRWEHNTSESETAYLDHFIQIWDAETGKSVQNIDLKVKNIGGFDISPDNKLLAVSTATNTEGNVISSSGELILYNFTTGTKLKTMDQCSGQCHNWNFLRPQFTPDGSSLIWWNVVEDLETGTQNKFKGVVAIGGFSQDGKKVFISNPASPHGHGDIVNWKTRKIVNKDVAYKEFEYENDQKYFVEGGNGQTIIYDAKTDKELTSSFVFGDGEWVTITPEGYYDASKDGTQYLNVRIGMEVLPMDNFFETYYRPDIVRAALDGRNVSELTASDIRTSTELPPSVRFTSPSNNATSEDQQLIISTEITDRGGGIDEVRLFHNGKVISTDTRGLKVVSGGNTLNPEFEVNLLPGENVFRLIAFSEGDRIESNPAKLSVNYEGAKSNTRLFTLVIGINEYKNPKYSLNYARSDASGFEERIIKGGESIFDEVVQTTITDADATKQNIFAALDKIKAAAGPEDMFVFYYAGHGVMSDPMQGSSEFFMAPTDVTQLYGNETLLKSRGIAASEIQEYSKNIMAQKQLFVLDACQSGGATEMLAMRGAAEEKAIAQLARSTGTFWLTASGSEQFATEFATLGHGVFTYALLEGLNGKADQGAKDNKITVQELSAFLNDRVPELTQIHKGQAQYPSSYGYGQDFPLTVIAN